MIKTPAYVFDVDSLKNRILMIKQELGQVAHCCFAMKANPFLVEYMQEYTDFFEVCSPGEYEICARKGISSKKIIVSGVNKTKETMERIFLLGQGNGIFTIESRMHYEILSSLAKEKGIVLKVVIRLSSGNQFGVDKEEFESILTDVIADEYLTYHGLHYYSGTQKKTKKVKAELVMLDEFAAYLKEKYNVTGLLEYGPGLEVFYFQADKLSDDGETLVGLRESLLELENFTDINIELGRFIASYCGEYYTKVIDIKENEGHKYAIVDGGIHQLNYYGQLMGMKHPEISLAKEKNGDAYTWNICGSLCTVNDVIVRDISLPELERDDILIFRKCGAYSVTEGMALFLSRELPAIYIKSKENDLVQIRDIIQTNATNCGC